jgi:hypothetical protein
VGVLAAPGSGRRPLRVRGDRDPDRASEEEDGRMRGEELIPDVFREGIPGWEELEPQIREWLEAGLDLEAIRERIFDHIMLHLEDEDAEDADLKAMEMAFEATSGLIANLPVSEENLERLLDYIRGYHDWWAYQRLLSDFLPLMTEEQMRDALDRAGRVFIPEVIREWERNVRKEQARRRRRA